MKLFCLLILTALSLIAQTLTHSVTLTWVNPAQNPTGTTTSLYRLTGTCPASPPVTSPPSGFTQLTTGLTTSTYTDSSVAGGTTYCYVAVAVSGSSLSAPSNTATGAVPATFPPQTLQVTVAQ